MKRRRFGKVVKGKVLTKKQFEDLKKQRAVELERAKAALLRLLARDDEEDSPY